MRLAIRHLLVAALLLASGPVRAADSASADLVEFMQRQAALKPNDAASRLDLAKWCHGKSLFVQMADLCSQVLVIDPENRPAYSMLREYDSTHTMPAEPDVAAAVQKDLKERFSRDFKVKETRHYIIVYDTTDQFAAARGAQLEQAYNMFYVYFDMQRLRPQFLQHRLISIAFKNYDDFVKFAKDVDSHEVSWAAGYYSGRTNHSVFYDDSTGPAGVKLDKMIADTRAQIADLNQQITNNQKKGAIAVANDLIRQRNDLNTKVLSMTRNTDALFEGNNSVKALHEATHQMAFNTGIQSRFVDYPVWLSEGLATSFEATAKDGSRGPDVVNTLRLDSVHDGVRNKKFTPLRTFLDSTPAAMDNDTAAIFYAESWSLFHFLYHTDRTGLEKYLNALLAQKPGVRLSHDQQLKLFTDAFGPDIDATEEKWKKYLQTL